MFSYFLFALSIRDIFSSSFKYFPFYTKNKSIFKEIMASVNLLKGKVFEAMDNRSSALDFYVQALQKSVFCVEALDALLHHEMLVAWEGKLEICAKTSY